MNESNPLKARKTLKGLSVKLLLFKCALVAYWIIHMHECALVAYWIIHMHGSVLWGDIHGEEWRFARDGGMFVRTQP